MLILAEGTSRKFWSVGMRININHFLRIVFVGMGEGTDCIPSKACEVASLADSSYESE